MAWGYTYRASWAPLALFSQVWLVSDCEIVCGKRFGNQWFWQVGALLVALQVYNHSFRGSVPRLGNRSFSLCPRFIHSLAFSSKPIRDSRSGSLRGRRIFEDREFLGQEKSKSKNIFEYFIVASPSSSYSHLQFRWGWEFREYSSQ